VILASGGYHANLDWRSRYLGKNWDLAKVRGSRFNTGDGIRIAMEQGAIPHGNWTGCHSVFYDLNAPSFGDTNLLNQQKNYFSTGIVVNANGQRFLNEGEEFRNYIYSLMGAKVLEQPGGIAWQIFDGKTIGLLPDEYRVKHATRFEASTLEELAAKMEGINVTGFLKTVAEFNQSVREDIPFQPAVKDGKRTEGLALEKTNWAQKIDKPPYVAYAVTCGITCTYGGVKVDTFARVLDQSEEPIPGLYATGEMVGGLYYIKYAGGAGLTAGSVLGRTAGREAAERARATS
jgi:tricarballylate dehydrogenase